MTFGKALALKFLQDPLLTFTEKRVLRHSDMTVHESGKVLRDVGTSLVRLCRAEQRTQLKYLHAGSGKL